jgi:hypothetical protein
VEKQYTLDIGKEEWLGCMFSIRFFVVSRAKACNI